MTEKSPFSPQRSEKLRIARYELIAKTIYPREPRELIEGVAADIDILPKDVAKVVMGMIRSGDIAVRYQSGIMPEVSLQAAGNQARQLFLPGLDPATEFLPYKQILKPRSIEATRASSQISPLSYGMREESTIV